MREDKYCNYRMKLITKKVEKDFMSHPLRSQDGRGFDAEVIVKYFNPCGAGTWLITEAEEQEDGDWLLFGYACIHEWEWGLRPAVRTTESAAAFRHDHRARPLFVGPDRPRTPETFRDHRLTGEAHLLYIGTINTCRFRYTRKGTIFVPE